MIPFSMRNCYTKITEIQFNLTELNVQTFCKKSFRLQLGLLIIFTLRKIAKPHFFASMGVLWYLNSIAILATTRDQTMHLARVQSPITSIMDPSHTTQQTTNPLIATRLSGTVCMVVSCACLGIGHSPINTLLLLFIFLSPKNYTECEYIFGIQYTFDFNLIINQNNQKPKNALLTFKNLSVNIEGSQL